MSVLALHHHPDEREIRRYGAAAIAIVALHAAVIAAALLWYERPEPAGVTLQPIMVDLMPAPTAQRIQPEDLAPGPQVQEAEAPPIEPPKTEKIDEQLPPTPPQPEPVVAAPPKVEPKPEPVEVKPKPVPEREKKPIKERRVEKSTAAKADRVAPDRPSPTSGASAAAAAASYRSRLVAHLARFKRWPSGAEARGERGKALVNFTLTRDGRVRGARLTKSTGFASLDQEAMAWIRRAQPMPPFPAEIRASSMNFTAPLSWERR